MAQEYVPGPGHLEEARVDLALGVAGQAGPEGVGSHLGPILTPSASPGADYLLRLPVSTPYLCPPIWQHFMDNFS